MNTTRDYMVERGTHRRQGFFRTRIWDAATGMPVAILDTWFRFTQPRKINAAITRFEAELRG